MGSDTEFLQGNWVVRAILGNPLQNHARRKSAYPGEGFSLVVQLSAVEFSEEGNGLTDPLPSAGLSQSVLPSQLRSRRAAVRSRVRGQLRTALRFAVTLEEFRIPLKKPGFLEKPSPQARLGPAL